MALNNEASFHLAAILWRRSKLISIGINSSKYSNSFIRYYKGEPAFCGHAEMIALRNAREGDELEVIRWLANGSKAMAKPCKFCQMRIKRIGIKVRYTNNEGLWEKLDV